MVSQRVRIYCPKCLRRLDVRAENLGKKGLCRFCGHKFRANAQVEPAGSPRQDRAQQGTASEGAALGSRVRTLEFEFQELLNQLASQASDHMAALQELHEARHKLRDLDVRERQAEDARRERRRPEPVSSSDSLFAWEVQALSEEAIEAKCRASDTAEPSTVTQQPPVHLFAPSSDGLPPFSGEVPALPAPPDEALVAERDHLREEVESLQAQLAERTAALERQSEEHERDATEARARRSELEGLVAALETELEQQCAEAETLRARCADTEQGLADTTAAHDRLRHRLSEQEAEHGQVTQGLAAERDALTRKTLKLRARLQEAEDAVARVEGELTQAREQWETECRERLEREAERQQRTEQSRREDAESWAAERAELHQQRDQVREQLDALEQLRLDDASRVEQERLRWESERRSLLAESERALDEQRAQFAIERQSLQQQLDAGRGTEEEYQVLRHEAESLSQLLEATRHDRDDAQRRAEAAEHAAAEAATQREHAEAGRAEADRARQAEREMWLAEREQARVAKDGAAQSAEQQVYSLRAEIDRLNGERQALALEHEDALSALRNEWQEARHALEAQREAATRDLQASNDELTQARRELEIVRQDREQTKQQLDELARHRDDLSGTLAEAEAAHGRTDGAWETEARRLGEESRQLQRELADVIRRTKAEADAFRAEVERREQERDVLQHERSALQQHLDQIEAARLSAATEVQAIVERLRTVAVNAAEARDEALRQLEEMRQERDRLAAEAAAGPPTNGQEQVELIGQARLLHTALAERSQKPPAAPGSCLRPQSQAFTDPGAFRAALSQWLNHARQLRQQATVQMGRLEGEINTAAGDLANLERDLALSEMEQEDDLVFGLDGLDSDEAS